MITDHERRDVIPRMRACAPTTPSFYHRSSIPYTNFFLLPPPWQRCDPTCGDVLWQCLSTRGPILASRPVLWQSEFVEICESCCVQPGGYQPLKLATAKTRTFRIIFNHRSDYVNKISPSPCSTFS